MKRSTAGATVALLLVFAAGAAAGVALDRTWLAPEGDAADQAAAAEADAGEETERRDDDGRERTVIRRFSEELELTRSQRTRIDTILAHFRDRMHQMWTEVRPRYRTLVDSARNRIIEVLDEGQARRYRELLEREAERREEHWGDETSDSVDTADDEPEDGR